MDRGTTQVDVPAWFQDVAVMKAGNMDDFLAGAADYVRSHRH